MPRFAFPLPRLLWSIAALLMLHWNALALEGGDLRAEATGFASLQPAGHAKPFVLVEIGQPVAAEERQSGTTQPPAEDQAIVPPRIGTGPSHARLRLEALVGMALYIRVSRAFNARAPPDNSA